MSHDQYGRPQQGYGYTTYSSPADGATLGGGPSARAMMPTVGQMGGQGPVPWVRYPFFPTAPFYSTNPAVGHQIRYYSAGLLGTDQDVTLGSETIRVVQFDIPCRVVAINASCTATTAAAAALAPFTVNIDPRDMFLFRVEYTTGDKLHISARLGSTVTGTAQRPGELGGVGYTIDQGGGLILGITPSPMLSGLAGAFRIDITLHALEIRGSSNFVGGR